MATTTTPQQLADSLAIKAADVTLSDSAAIEQRNLAAWRLEFAQLVAAECVKACASRGKKTYAQAIAGVFGAPS